MFLWKAPEYICSNSFLYKLAISGDFKNRTVFALNPERSVSLIFAEPSQTDFPSNIKLGQSTVSVYFSPQDKPIKNRIIPLVQNAKAYIYIPVFVITEKNLVRELKNARSRGVDVRIITDATGAANKYSPVDDMRNSGIKIKIENRAGKMHSKTILIDDEYLIAGSMNLSKSGENYNDENMVVIRDRKIAAVYKKYFLHLWNAIPDKWLYKNPGAESLNSVNSCYDGIDNDYDGKIDAQDEGCSERFL